MQWPIEWYIARRYVMANPRQALIIMLAVGIGVAIIVFIPSINLSFFESFLNDTVENNPHININREIDTMPRNREALLRVFPDEGRILFSDQTATRRRNIIAYRKLMAELQRLPGVTMVSPFIQEQVIAVRGNQSRAANLNGMIPERQIAISNIEEHVVQGDFEDLGSDEVFLGYVLADELGVNMGDRIQLVTAFGNRSYKVAGLLRTGVYQQDLTSIHMNLQAAQDLVDLSGQVTGIGIRLANMYDAETLAQVIENTYTVDARSWMEENRVFLDQINNFKIIIAVINFLIIFAAATSITSILIMVVASKSKEIGILKAMGASPQAIMRLFVIQAMFLSLLGAAAGFFGALGLLALYNASPMAQGETFIGVERDAATLNAQYTILAFVYAFISSVLASLFPAWRASRLDPVEAING